MIFSKMAQGFGIPANSLYAERRRLEAAGRVLNDLVAGNVTSQGIVFPEAILRRAFQGALRRSARYAPHPLGQSAAREAIARHYRSAGLDIVRDQILLTPGTSLAYAYLFQILADAGGEILCPRPCYPLFDLIARAAHVELTSYALHPAQRWMIDIASIESAITPRTRAIVMVSPHHPTGAVASSAELAQVAAVASRHQLPLIADEVFSPFLLAPSQVFPRAAATSAPLVFSLGGLSKMFALPGLKVGWIAVSGERGLVDKALAALEVVADTYLPVNELAQAALPNLFRDGSPFLKSYALEIRRRSEIALAELAKLSGVSFIRPEGGFYVTLRLPDSDEEEICMEWLQRYHVVSHPGYFYDLEGSHLILSVVQRSAHLRRGLKSLRKILS